MAIPRSVLLPARPVWTHVISRCVRKAYLCGGRDGRWEYRRQWIEDRLAELTKVFAVEVASYAVMSNHVHAVVRMSPEIAASWSADEVATRWLAVFGKNADKMVVNGDRGSVTQSFVANAEWIAQRRERLASLAWFMRAFKEPLARRANLEEKCSGRFWEGRFTSVPLLDQAALVACMAYVDLNPVRARMAPTPETSVFTSVRQRAQARQRHRVANRLSTRESAVTAAAAKPAEKDADFVALTEHELRGAGVTGTNEAAVRASPEAGIFVAPLARCRHLAEGAPTSSWTLSTDDYLTLVDLTGRVIRPGKRGAIDPRLPAILARLDLRVNDWIATMVGWRQMQGSGIGHPESRQAAAATRKLQWIRNRCPLFARRA